MSKLRAENAELLAALKAIALWCWGDINAYGARQIALEAIKKHKR